MVPQQLADRANHDRAVVSDYEGKVGWQPLEVGLWDENEGSIALRSGKG